MTNSAAKNRQRLKNFSVGYYLEEGFVISVKAKSAADAERIIRKRLDEECGELAGSDRVHYDDGITATEEVRS